MTVSNPKFPKINYNDFTIRILATFLAAYIVTEYGGNEPLLPRLVTLEFYIEFGTSFFITFLLVEYIYRITRYLDSRYPWDLKLAQRIVLQILTGILLPTLSAYLMAAVYFAILSANITETNYHLYALPFIASLITLFNGYYLVRYLIIKAQENNHGGVSILQTDRLSPLHKSSNSAVQFSTTPPFNEEQAIENNNPTPTNSNANEKEVFLVNTVLQTIPIRTEDICSFYRSSGINYVRKYGQTVNDAYIISQTLKEVEEQISPIQFFRINRQMIISFKSCVSFRNGKGKSLELTVHPPHIDGENGMKELPFVTVSEDRVREFRAWIER
jgi:hypothetical protein